MARRRKRAAPAASAMVCPPGQCGPKCIVLGLVGAAAAGLGLWLVVAGFLKQSAGMTLTSAWMWYAGGFLVFGVAKCIKKKACGMCR